MVSCFSLALLGACGDNRDQPQWGCTGSQVPSIPSTVFPWDVTPVLATHLTTAAVHG